MSYLIINLTTGEVVDSASTKEKAIILQNDIAFSDPMSDYEYQEENSKQKGKNESDNK